MGVRERAEMLCRGPAAESGAVKSRAAAQSSNAAEPSETRTKRIRQGMQRLTERGGGGMGRIYKALALVPENGGKRSPVGFGGDL